MGAASFGTAPPGTSGSCLARFFRAGLEPDVSRRKHGRGFMTLGAPGARRAKAIDAALSGGTTDPELATWTRDVLPSSGGSTLRGLSPLGLTEDWLSALAWAGTPLAPQGALLWGRDLIEEAHLATPCERDGVLILPSPERLRTLNGVELRPLRLFIAARLGMRLQTAPGVRWWQWPDRALLVSLLDEPVGGFLYAPTLSHRSSILLPPGGWQLMRGDCHGD